MAVGTGWVTICVTYKHEVAILLTPSLASQLPQFFVSDT